MESKGIEYTAEEIKLIQQCLQYAESGWIKFPGHNLIMLVAKLAKENKEVSRAFYELGMKWETAVNLYPDLE